MTSHVIHAEKRVLPTQVGHYLIQDKLGAGGMGEVYRAWDTRLERAVAVKKVHSKDSFKEGRRERLRSEARIIASLSHPAIVRVYDLLEGADSDWIVMELVEGPTLRNLIGTREIQEIEAITLAREITEGLMVAHSQGLVHRDLKSENVMITPLGHVKILDFGLAQVFDDPRSSAASPPRQRVVGTSRAMSPEQAKGLNLDPRSDLFSLGSLLYEMVTGSSPFEGPSTYVTMTRVCYHRQRPARELQPAVSAELSNFLDHLLEKDPERRPQSAVEISAVLDSLAGIAPLPPSLVHLLWPTESTIFDATALTDSTAGIPRFLPTSLLSSDGLPSSIFVWTVLALDLTNAGELLRRCGDEQAARIFLCFDRAVRDLLEDFKSIEIDKADGFLLLFRRPTDGVRFVLTLREKLETLSRETGAALVTRIGLHVGEIELRENSPEDVERGAKRFEASGRARVIAAQVKKWAAPGQILVTEGVYDLARLARLKPLPVDQEVVWREHGDQEVPGLDEAVSLFELALARNGTELVETLKKPRRPARRKPPYLRIGALGLISLLILVVLWLSL